MLKNGGGCANSNICIISYVGEWISLTASRWHSEHISCACAIAKSGLVIGAWAFKAILSATSDGTWSTTAAASFSTVSASCGLGRSQTTVGHQALSIDGKADSWLAVGPVVILITWKEGCWESIVCWRAATGWAESSLIYSFLTDLYWIFNSICRCNIWYARLC